MSARVLIASLVLSAPLVGALDTARADDPPPPKNVPAVDAYVEMVPTAAGPSSGATGKPRVKSLPPHVRKVVRKRAGKEASTLLRISTSSQYGAPTETLAPEAAPPPATTTPPTVKPRPASSSPAKHAAHSSQTPPTPTVVKPATPAPHPRPRPRAAPVGSDVDLENVFFGSDSGRVLAFAAILLAITLAAVGARVLRRSS